MSSLKWFAVAWLTVLALVAQAPPRVLASFPANAAVGISPAASIRLTFDQPMDVTQFVATDLRVAGRWSGPVPGSIQWDSAGRVLTFRPSRPLFAAEIGTLILKRGARSATGAAMVDGFTASWFVGSIQGSGTFALAGVVDYRRPGEGLVRTYGFFAGDIDRDGAPDMSATNEVSYDVRLLKNDGAGSYGPLSITAMPSGQEPSPNEGADLNGDGWLDLVTGNQLGQTISVFLNDGAGGYLAPVQYAAFGPVHGMALGDFDGDADVDVVATNFASVLLYLNDGAGNLGSPNVVSVPGAGTWSVQAGDANNDGFLDLFVGSFQSRSVALLLGDGRGNFNPTGNRTNIGTSWQMALGDLDRDGALDCVVCDNSGARAAVLRGDGLGGLSAPTFASVGALPVSVDVGDLEGDGDLDVICATFVGNDASVLINTGFGSFLPRASFPAAIAGSCAVIVDDDRDGDTDFILVDELSDQGFIYRQVGPNLPGVQAPSSAAALRVNGFAGRAGFGSRPIGALPVGETAFVDVSGPPLAPFLLAVGNASSTPAATAAGLLHLAFDASFATIVDGVVAGSPLGVLDAFGEARFGFPVPPATPPGLFIAIQALVAGPTPTLTNAERLATL